MPSSAVCIAENWKLVFFLLLFCVCVAYFIYMFGKNNFMMTYDLHLGHSALEKVL